MNSSNDNPMLLELGCPIRKSPDQSLLAAIPRLIAASCVLHRLLAPRHSPIALSSLITKFTSTNLGLLRIAPNHPGSAEELSEHCNYLPYFGLCVVVKEPSEPHLPKDFTPRRICSGKSLSNGWLGWWA
jgi:hypothetical protein